MPKSRVRKKVRTDLRTERRRSHRLGWIKNRSEQIAKRQFASNELVDIKRVRDAISGAKKESP